MVDVIKMEKGNISLPKSLQSPDIQDRSDNKEKEIRIFNMQTTLYHVKIEDLENRIKRLEDRNQSILDEYSSTELAFNRRDAETADEIMTINQEISREVIKIKTKQQEIQNMEQLRLENKMEHEKNIKILQDMYKKTRIDLISKLKTLNARINTLQDFQDNKQQLLEKFAKSVELFQENENAFKTNLNEIDRKFKIAKEKMKNDLHKRLFTLAQDFQCQIMERLSPSTHRLIRENIIIKNDCSQILNDNISKEAENLEMQYAAEMYDNQLKEKQRQNFLKLITCKIQENLISTIKSQNTKLQKILTTSKKILHCSQEKEKEFCRELKIEENLDFQRRQLQVLSHQAKVKISFASNKQRQSRNTVKKLTQTLNDITFIVFSALKLSESDEDIETMTYEQLLHCLMNHFENESESPIETINSTETVFPVDIHQRKDLDLFTLRIGNDFSDENELLNESSEHLKIKNSTTLKNIEVDLQETKNSTQENSTGFNDSKLWNFEQDEEFENLEYLSESDN